MSKHQDDQGRLRRYLPRVAIVLVLAMLGAAAFVLLSSGGAVPIHPASPAPSVEAATPPTSTVPPENHVEMAHAIDAGQVAADASAEVNQAREAAAGNPAVVAAQARLDQASPLSFAPDTARLTPAAEARLDRLIGIMHDDPAIRVQVVGHTAVEIADPALCLQLSQLRAERVAIRLEGAGIAPDRVSAIGVSHEQPRETFAESRRVELVAR